MTAKIDGVEWALDLDGKGGATTLDPTNLGAPQPGASTTRWIHLDASNPASREWLEQACDLDADILDAFFAAETRPRLQLEPSGLLLIVRGLNPNPNQEPEAMVALRLWVEPSLVLSSRRQPVHAARSVREHFEGGRGPKSSGSLLLDLLATLITRMGPFVDQLEAQGDDIQDSVLDHKLETAGTSLSNVRRRVIALRRHFLPQRDTLTHLQNHPPAWLIEEERDELRELVQLQTRYTEDLDALRDRLAVTQEELKGLTDEKLNHRLYTLSLITAVFLPLTFLTGLLGINVGGIPGADHPGGFAIVAIATFALAVISLIFLRFLKWF